MNRLLVTLLSFSFALAGASHAQTTKKQTIVLTNGTTLVGELVAESATEVTFRDSVLGTLQFSRGHHLPRGSRGHRRPA